MRSCDALDAVASSAASTQGFVLSINSKSFRSTAIRTANAYIGWCFGLPLVSQVTFDGQY